MNKPDAIVAKKIRAGDRAALARAITLVESKKPAHRAEAQELLRVLLPFTGKAIRVGITGAPGVGKRRRQDLALRAGQLEYANTQSMTTLTIGISTRSDHQPEYPALRKIRIVAQSRNAITNTATKRGRSWINASPVGDGFMAASYSNVDAMSA